MQSISQHRDWPTKCLNLIWAEIDALHFAIVSLFVAIAVKTKMLKQNNLLCRDDLILFLERGFPI